MNSQWPPNRWKYDRNTNTGNGYQINGINQDGSVHVHVNDLPFNWVHSQANTRSKPLRKQIAELTAILALITITATFVSVLLHSMKPHLNSARSFESSANDLSCSGLIPLHKVTSTEKINTWDLTPSSSLSTSWTTQRPTSNWQQAENNINFPASTPNST